MIDLDLARELIILKAKDLGLSDDDLQSLDDFVCKMLNIENPDPLIFPT
jgi:hypothetical protein